MSTQKLMYCRNVEVLDSANVQLEKLEDPTGAAFRSRCLRQFKSEIREALSDLDPRQAKDVRSAEADRLASEIVYGNLYLTDFARNYSPSSQAIEDRFRLFFLSTNNHKSLGIECQWVYSCPWANRQAGR